MSRQDRCVTRVTARLVDPAQEARFRAYNLCGQRSTVMLALVIVVLVSLVSFLLSFWGAEDVAYGPARIAVQVFAVAMGAVMVVVLRRARSPRVIERAAAVTIGTVSLLVAGMITFGPEQAVQGPLLVAAGVLLVYLATPFGLVGTAAMGLFYSAVTVPAWLVGGVVESPSAVRYTLVGVVLAHALSIVTTRRLLTERRLLFAQREQLEALSTIDPLTGLANRRVLDRMLPELWRRCHVRGRPLAMLMIDIDYFKRFNDNYGHLAGDHALRQVAGVIAGAVPPGTEPLAARYGGEEFAVLLPEVDRAGAAAVARRIASSVQGLQIAHRAARDGSVVLTVSIGIAQTEPGMGRPDELVRAADRDLYLAKSVRAAAAAEICA